MASSNQIVFFDTTLRDGEQSPGCTMHHDEKLRMAHQLANLGVDVLEAGFAIASEGDFNAVRAIAREVKGTRIASLARCKREDIEAAARAVEPAPSNRIHVFLASSDLHLEAKLKITREQALDQVAESVRLARTFVDDVEFSTEDGTRTDPEFLLKMITVAVQAGATTINIPDTVGYTTPAEYEAIFRMRQSAAFPASKTSSSPPTATTTSAWPSPTPLPASRAEHARSSAPSTASASALATPLSKRSPPRSWFAAISSPTPTTSRWTSSTPPASCSRVHQLRLLAQQGCRRSQRLRARVRHPPARHDGQSAHLRDHDAASVGVANTNLVLGKHSGRRALADRLENSAITHTHELDEVYHRFTELADRKKYIYDQDLLGLLQPDKSTVVTH